MALLLPTLVYLLRLYHNNGGRTPQMKWFANNSASDKIIFFTFTLLPYDAKATIVTRLFGCADLALGLDDAVLR